MKDENIKNIIGIAIIVLLTILLIITIQATKLEAKDSTITNTSGLRLLDINTNNATQNTLMKTLNILVERDIKANEQLQEGVKEITKVLTAVNNTLIKNNTTILKNSEVITIHTEQEKTNIKKEIKK